MPLDGKREIIRQSWLPERDPIYTLRSAILDNERPLWVHTPKEYATGGAPYPLLIVFDGPAYTYFVPTPTILEHLRAKGMLPPMVAVLLGNDQRLVELFCHMPFVDFLAHELIPWVRQNFHVSADPAQTIVAGSSLGGLTAAFAALRRPDLFGNVLSQSGTFFWAPEGDSEYEWLARQYVAAPTLPLRFYLNVGRREDWPLPFDSTAPTLLISNRHMRDVLQAKGYDVSYAEHAGDHTYLWWQQTLGEGLIALMGTGQAEKAG